MTCVLVAAVRGASTGAMSLHNEDGIAPDSGVTGPRDREEHPHDLAPDAQLEDDPLNQEHPKVPDAEANEPDEDPGNPVSVDESA